MKGKSIDRGLKTFAVSVALGLGMTACSRDYVVGYLYATNAKANPGLITAYSIDYQSGQLTQLSDSPIPSGGNNTVTIVASPNGQYLYIVNHDTSDVVEAAIGTDGKIYPANTYNVVQGSGFTGTYPVSAAVDPGGKFLFIAFTYQNGYTTVRPGPGGIATFPIKSDGSLGAPLTNTTVGTTAATPLPYVPVGNNPAALTVSAAGGFVYVIDQESAPGKLLTFAENTTTGVLSVAGSPTGVTVGGTPSAITTDPAGKFLYVTDSTANQVYTYVLASGIPPATPTSQTATGGGPDAVRIDPRGKFGYVANYTSSSVTTYTVNSTSGALTPLTSNATLSVGTGPTCIAIDPALGVYLYTSNNISNSISAAQLNTTTGALIQVQGAPYSSQTLPTCLVAVANGAHATQLAQ
jgi:6-phosphogluconolactonase (cycloisomerase 2 family)